MQLCQILLSFSWYLTRHYYSHSCMCVFNWASYLQSELLQQSELKDCLRRRVKGLFLKNLMTSYSNGGFFNAAYHDSDTLEVDRRFVPYYYYQIYYTITWWYLIIIKCVWLSAVCCLSILYEDVLTVQAAGWMWYLPWLYSRMKLE